MSSSLRKPSFVFATLFAISCIASFVSALPRGLRLREAQLPGFPSSVSDCVKGCISKGVAQQNCQGGGQECLCRGDLKKFQDFVWSCIDGDCGETSQDLEGSIMNLCNESKSTPIPTLSTSTKPASVTDPSESATVASATSSTLRSFQTVPTTSQIPISSAAVTGGLPTPTAGADADSSSGATASGSAGAVKESTVLSTTAIIGVSIGSFCLLAAVVGACAFCACRKNHRRQAKSLEPHSPRGGAAVGGGKEYLGCGGWVSIDNTSGSYPKKGVPLINTDVANEKSNAHLDPNISPVSPVSSSILQGFEFGDFVQQRGKVVGSQKIIENSHLSTPPAAVYTSASPIGSVDRTSDSVILPSPARNRTSSSHFSVHAYNDHPGIAISTDSPGASPMSLNCHTYSPTSMERLDHPSDPFTRSRSPPEYTSSPVSERSVSIRSSIHSSQGQLSVGISRSDTLAWRRELDEAAGRAITRVLRSEQSINEEIDEAKRRRGSIPGLDRLLKRLSRDHKADEESSSVRGERYSGFWGSFGSKDGRKGSPPRNPGFMSRRPNSGASGGSRRGSGLV